MPEHPGRPKFDVDDTVAMTLRVPKYYYGKLAEYADECGIRSTNGYSMFMLISHVNGVETDKRNALLEEPSR